MDIPVPWKAMPVSMIPYLSGIPGLTPADYLICVAIVTVTPNRYPSAAMLAKQAGLSRRTIQRRLAVLRRLEIVGGSTHVRVKGGLIAEVNLEPLWKRLGNPEPEQLLAVQELLTAHRPALDPRLDDAKLLALGPDGATPEDARAVRQVINSLGTAETWGDVAQRDHNEVMELETAKDIDIEAALKVFPLTTIDSLHAKRLSKELLPVAPGQPEFLGAPALIERRSMPAEAFERFYNETLVSSIGLYYPLWSDGETLNALAGFVDAAYGQPARSHTEVWETVASAFRSYLRRRAAVDGFQWKDEKQVFENAYEMYVVDCDINASAPLDLDDFRRRYYQLHEFREYRQ